MPAGRPARAIALGAGLVMTSAGLVSSCSDDRESFATATSDEPGPGTRIPEPFDALTPVAPDSAPPAQPFVSCAVVVPRDGGGGADGGPDGSSDAGDAGQAASPCDEPPVPDCATPTVMLTYQRGTCVAGMCDFHPTVRSCPGGCFRRIDGGYGCQP